MKGKIFNTKNDDVIAKVSELKSMGFDIEASINANKIIYNIIIGDKKVASTPRLSLKSESITKAFEKMVLNFDPTIKGNKKEVRKETTT